LFDFWFGKVYFSMIWFRMLMVFFLLKIKQTNDVVLKQMQRKPVLSVLPQRLLIATGAILDYIMLRIRPSDRTMAELKKMPQQQYPQPQQQHFLNRQTYKPDAFITTRQSVVVTKQDTVMTRNPPQDYSNMTDKDQLHARLATGGLSASDMMPRSVDSTQNPDISRLHSQLKPTDVELLYSKLPTDIVPDMNNGGPLTVDQQMLHAKVIGAELEQQGYEDDDDVDDEEEENYQ